MDFSFDCLYQIRVKKYEKYKSEKRMNGLNESSNIVSLISSKNVFRIRAKGQYILYILISTEGAFINHVDMAGGGGYQMSILLHKPY